LNLAVTGKQKVEETGQTTIESGGGSSVGLAGVGVTSINLNLHF
jgi:hypothetical protein